MTDQTLLSLVVSPLVEDTLVDWLLAHDEVPGFTSAAVNGHGSSVHSMSLAEQVSGRRRQVLFQLHLPTAQCDGLVDALKNDFGNSGIHFILQAAQFSLQHRPVIITVRL